MYVLGLYHYTKQILLTDYTVNYVRNDFYQSHTIKTKAQSVIIYDALLGTLYTLGVRAGSTA